MRNVSKCSIMQEEENKRTEMCIIRRMLLFVRTTHTHTHKRNDQHNSRTKFNNKNVLTT